jgi:signal transduction histidine kinase
MKLSVRFKLSLWYSVILIITAIIYIALTNLIVTHQLNKDPRELNEQVAEVQMDFLNQAATNGSEHDYITFRQILDEIHQRDLEWIRLASLLVFVALVVAAFIGGYMIAGHTLKPLYSSLEIQKQFIANASHELKTPLAASQINIEAALHDASMTRQELESYLQQAMQSTTFMNQLIEDLLLLAVTDEQIQFTDIDVAAVVQQAVSQLQPVAAAAQKTVTLDNQAADGISKQGNATLLQRAVMNCIENAIKYAKSSIRVTVMKKDKQAVITITDDGEGIPPEALPKVTERFYRVDSSRSRTSGGTGLGLAITKSIIDHHHGRLHITSTFGSHTTVTIQV